MISLINSMDFNDMATLLNSRPTSTIDFWSDAVIAEPYPHYEALRALGPAVWLENHSAWAVVRHGAIRKALLDGQTFSSAHGCMMSDQINHAFTGTMLCSDDPEHRNLRRVFARPLLPNALAPLKARLAEIAEARVVELIKRQSFDAVTDLAHLLPLTVVTDLVGLSADGKRHMLRWAAAVFDAFGPETHSRSLGGMEIVGEAFQYLGALKPEDLDPDGWGAALFVAADRGEVSAESAKAMLMDYLAPSLDTTINAISSAVALFAAYPEQWDLLRADPKLIPAAIDEVIRLESPIRAFSRLLTQDHDLGGVQLAAGERALMVYASGNRDERRYVDPETFDISRDARDHLGFGYGPHLCAGMSLAKLEITVILETLIRHVRRFHVIKERRDLNNTLRGIASLTVTIDGAN